MNNRIFIDRRVGKERRRGGEPRRNPRLDLSVRRRRKTDDRRGVNRTMKDDFYAVIRRPFIEEAKSIN